MTTTPYRQMTDRSKAGVLRRAAKYAKTEKGKVASRARTARYRERHPERVRAWADSEHGQFVTRSYQATRKGHVPCKDIPPPRPENRKCQLCERAVKLVPDHDHKTGLFRGWLCDRCNLGIGGLGDDLESLERAVEYLKRAKAMNNIPHVRELPKAPESSGLNGIPKFSGTPSEVERRVLPRVRAKDLPLPIETAGRIPPFDRETTRTITHG